MGKSQPAKVKAVKENNPNASVYKEGMPSGWGAKLKDENFR